MDTSGSIVKQTSDFSMKELSKHLRSLERDANQNSKYSSGGGLFNNLQQTPTEDKLLSFKKCIFKMVNGISVLYVRFYIIKRCSLNKYAL